MDAVGWQQDAGGVRHHYAVDAASLAGADDAAGASAVKGGGVAIAAAGAGAKRSAHRSYLLLVLGFFTCGFQLAFVTVHLPAYLVDRALSTPDRRLDHRQLSACSTS